MIELRHVTPDDIGHFFEHQLDPAANWMAASTNKDPGDRAAFLARWDRTLSNPAVTARTIAHGAQPVGYIASFLRDGTREVAYWLGKEHWGRGFATEALSRFLTELQERPLHARAAHDNVGSLRVLEKCGFRPVRTDRFVSAARGGEVEEIVFALGGSES